jgi:fibrillarin-like rRNA methylase
MVEIKADDIEYDNGKTSYTEFSVEKMRELRKQEERKRLDAIIKEAEKKERFNELVDLFIVFCSFIAILIFTVIIIWMVV